MHECNYMNANDPLNDNLNQPTLDNPQMQLGD